MSDSTTSTAPVGKSWGITASFRSAPAVFKAAEKVRDAGYKNWDVFTPFPIHGLDGAMGLKRSRVPIFTLIGGITGFFTGMLMVWYMNAYDYPLIVRGMPYFSPIFPFPIFYELTILLAAFGTLFGMFFLNRLPLFHHPVKDHPSWVKFTDDQFLIAIEAKDPSFDATRARALLGEIGGDEITEIREPAD
jgi:hypothetical protein